MSTLHFGVLDVAYVEEGRSTTTGDVATILEEKYGVMQMFIDLHEDEIGELLAHRMAGLINNVANDRPVPMGDVDFPKVDAQFRDYLDKGEWEKQTGMPTAAALAGKSKRKKSGKYDGPRPSFVDTGLYQKSFKTWISK
ncbi:MAG: hypothetical protein B7Y55_01125 [Polynucleobacter sp. 35-46-207]|jgi:hypothetical protein|nr:MAG: hypothetical protein B7Y55_01125 [Polynucleobacter sp. 35-46-207]OZB49413.1 MAG: hypothetical protein B7X60_01235 [Polynucleobacter sp. 39-45-136]